MYEHILFATDFSLESSVAGVRAMQLAEQCEAKLSVIHVIDYTSSERLDSSIANAVGGLPKIEDIMRADAQKDMDDCAVKLLIDPKDTHIGIGSPKKVIAQYANEIGVDAIVMGSHGRHGFGVLLGSTASGVLHIATCDVLAVRIEAEASE